MAFSDERKLATEIRSMVRKSAIIGVDGWTGAGKSTLAAALAAQVGGSSVDFDTFLIRDQNKFVSALKLDKLADALSNPDKLLFVSGICMRQVLDLIKCEAAAHIYVKRMAVWGWSDEDDLAGDLPEIGGEGGQALRNEMRAYHEQYHPHQNADYEFHWMG